MRSTDVCCAPQPMRAGCRCVQTAHHPLIDAPGEQRLTFCVLRRIRTPLTLSFGQTISASRLLSSQIGGLWFACAASTP